MSQCSFEQALRVLVGELLLHGSVKSGDKSSPVIDQGLTELSIGMVCSSGDERVLGHDAVIDLAVIEILRPDHIALELLVE